MERKKYRREGKIKKVEKEERKEREKETKDSGKREELGKYHLPEAATLTLKEIGPVNSQSRIGRDSLFPSSHV